MALWRVCTHLPAGAESYYQAFTGVGQHYDLLCPLCAKREPTLQEVSKEQFQEIERACYWAGIVGQPEWVRTPTGQRFQHEYTCLPGLEASMVKAVAALTATWLVLLATGELVELDLAAGTSRTIAQLEGTLTLSLHLGLCVSADESLVAAFEVRGSLGVVVERVSGVQRLALTRDADYADVTPFSVAFLSYQGRTLLVFATDWNRLDVLEPTTGECLTERGPTTYRPGEERPATYLDYFHGALYPSPDSTWIADDGWGWHPYGDVRWWSLPRWLEENVWESETVASDACLREGFWGGPLCWINATTLAVWGYGKSAKSLLPAVRLFDVPGNRELGWFPGPPTTRDEAAFWEPTVPFHEGWMVFDEVLFVCCREQGVSVWEVAAGALLCADPSFYPAAYQRATGTFLTLCADGAFQLSRLGRKSPLVGRMVG